MEHNDLKAIQLLKESGYDGTPVVILQITDKPFLNAVAVVTRRRLEQVGFKVILKAMDWSTNVVVRARKEPPDKGGWNLLYSWWHGTDVIDPSVHFGLSGGPERLVWLAECPATREACHRLGAREGLREAEATRRQNQ